jgi:hypothetical protein
MHFVKDAIPQRLKPMSVSQRFAARLKSCPFKAGQMAVQKSSSAAFFPRGVALLLAAGMAALAQGKPSTASPPAHPAAAAGYRIAGTVVNAATEEPVRRATVTALSEADFHEIELVETDNEGRFALEGLAAGKYPLTASKRGFLTSYYDQHEGGYNTAIVTGADQDTVHIVFRLTPGASLHGVVSADGGDPVEGASVMLFLKPRNHVPGARISRASETTTDDAGSYEFDGLAAGEYLLAVKAAPWYALNRSAAESRQRPADDPAAALDVAYPVTYFDSTTDESSAAGIALAGGSSDEANVNLRAVPALHLTVESPMTQDRTMTQPDLRQTVFGTAVSETHWRTSSDSAAGTIELTGVAPGHYQMMQGNPPRITELDATTNQRIDPSLGTPTVTVFGTMRMASGATLPGNLTLFLSPLDSALSARGASALSNQGSFSFPSVGPGRWELRALSQNSGGGGKMMTIVSTTVSGSTHAGNLVTVRDKPLTLTVALNDSETRVEGFARKDGKGMPGVMIALVPKESATYRALMRIDQSDSDGSFSLRDVAPGEYTVVAIEDGWEMDRDGPDAYRRYLSQGIAVTVTADSGKLVRLSEGVPVQSRRAQSGNTR